MTPEETEMVQVLIEEVRFLRRLLLQKDGAPIKEEKARNGNAIRQARHRAKQHEGVTSNGGCSVTRAVTNNARGVVSSKEDLESKKEPFKALSATLSGVTKSVTDSVTGNGAVVTPEHVTRLNIDPTSTDRDWRVMMRKQS